MPFAYSVIFLLEAFLGFFFGGTLDFGLATILINVFNSGEKT